MGSSKSRARALEDLHFPLKAAKALSLTRYIHMHTCSRAAKRMHLYAVWYEMFTHKRSRDTTWQTFKAEQLSKHFCQYLNCVGAKPFTRREMELYEAICGYHVHMRTFHNNHMHNLSLQHGL